jgi:hypothetical protein
MLKHLVVLEKKREEVEVYTNWVALGVTGSLPVWSCSRCLQVHVVAFPFFLRPDRFRNKRRLGQSATGGGN